MLGHGAAWRDNEKALAVLRQPRNAETLGAEGPEWNLPEQFRRWYRFADYANRLPPLATYFPEADGRDGERDGRWRGHRIEDDVVEGGFQTPARIPYQTRLLEELIAREGFGRGDRPDLLYVNYKVIDMVGHIFSMNSYEMRDTLRTQDEYLRHLIDILDREVGTGSWAMLVTADHGSTPHPRVSGAFQISSSKLQDAIDETFGRDGPVVEQVKQTEIFVDREQLAKTSATLRDVSTFVMSLTQRDLVSTGASASDPTAQAFEAAFPSGIIPSLPCAATEVGAS
jgi:hypothetical protein